jgi:hypothetical protein
MAKSELFIEKLAIQNSGARSAQSFLGGKGVAMK